MSTGRWDAVAETVTPQALATALVAKGSVTGEQLAELFGADPSAVTPLRFEAVLVEHGLISDARLLALKGMLAGLPTLEGTVGTVPTLDRAVASNAGAIVLDREPTTVAVVEPSDAVMAAVATAIGPHFETWLITSSQFTKLFAATYPAVTAAYHPLDTIDWVMKETVRLRASDCHLQVGRPPRLRVDGRLVPLATQPVTKEWMEQATLDIGGPQRKAELEAEFTSDFASDAGDRRFRVNLGKDREGWTAAIRLLANRIPTMDELGLSEPLRAFTELERGIVLVTGPTGSGKSTLLASILDHICRHQDRHVITLEDPVEYVLTSDGAAVVNQRELGVDFKNFPAAVRQALRQDPDVMLVGEMRDPETARAAVELAETGHLLFATLHTIDAQSSVERLVALMGDDQDAGRNKLSHLIRGVVSQKLLPRAGTPGRIAAQEIMLGTTPIANQLRTSNGLSQLRSSIQTASRDGMQTMEQACAALVRAGYVTEEDAAAGLKHQDDFVQALRGRPV